MKWWIFAICLLLSISAYAQEAHVRAGLSTSHTISGGLSGNLSGQGTGGATQKSLPSVPSDLRGPQEWNPAKTYLQRPVLQHRVIYVPIPVEPWIASMWKSTPVPVSTPTPWPTPTPIPTVTPAPMTTTQARQIKEEPTALPTPTQTLTDEDIEYALRNIERRSKVVWGGFYGVVGFLGGCVVAGTVFFIRLRKRKDWL